MVLNYRTFVIRQSGEILMRYITTKNLNGVFLKDNRSSNNTRKKKTDERIKKSRSEK